MFKTSRLDLVWPISAMRHLRWWNFSRWNGPFRGLRTVETGSFWLCEDEPQAISPEKRSSALIRSGRSASWTMYADNFFLPKSTVSGPVNGGNWLALAMGRTTGHQRKSKSGWRDWLFCATSLYCFSRKWDLTNSISLIKPIWFNSHSRRSSWLDTFSNETQIGRLDMVNCFNALDSRLP